MTNTDTHNTQLSGAIGPAPGGTDFTPQSGSTSFTLGSGGSASRTFTYTPGQRGYDSASVSITSNAGNVNRTLAGTGVGPVFSSQPPEGSLFDFGEVAIGEVAEQALTLYNVTSDGDLGALTDLTLLSAWIVGDGAECFDLGGFTPGTVLEQGQWVKLSVGFHPKEPLGKKTAKLVIVTDQNAAFGQSGDSFGFTLEGAAVPEPATLALLTLGGAALLRRRRTRP